MMMMMMMMLMLMMMMTMMMILMMIMMVIMVIMIMMPMLMMLKMIMLMLLLLLLLMMMMMVVVVMMMKKKKMMMMMKIVFVCFKLEDRRTRRVENEHDLFPVADVTLAKTEVTSAIKHRIIYCIETGARCMKNTQVRSPAGKNARADHNKNNNQLII
ncbi:hypothetical protein DPMN_152431 [Dreissena polymorpha]|uniref:Uncharacterized protein n=1 Tax=Dreissena polymorpha TaxID=45954 RepID=A0A9D4J7X2_DREPO|nr:hypothetical protein DPMN_152431 [Dreissena polymorpha]